MLAARAAVASCTIVEIRNAFPDMLCPDRSWLMLVAAKAGVAAGVIVEMAGRARGRVRAIEQEVFGMLEIGRLPRLLAVALPARRARTAMSRRVGRGVAGLAFRAGRRLQQGV